MKKKEKMFLKNEFISHKNIFIKYHRMKPTTWLRVISIVSHCTMDSIREPVKNVLAEFVR